jgi:hypothetical protein
VYLRAGGQLRVDAEALTHGAGDGARGIAGEASRKVAGGAKHGKSSGKEGRNGDAAEPFGGFDGPHAALLYSQR